MKLDREWITPITAGAFVLLGVTGILMFFHLDTGLNKLAHEWLGWVLLAAVALHLTLNFKGLKRQLSQPRGQILAGLFVLVLGLSFLPLGGNAPGGKAAFMATVGALADVPIGVLVQVARVDEATLSKRFDAAGHPLGDATTVHELIGADPGAQAALLAQVLRQR